VQNVLEKVFLMVEFMQNYLRLPFPLPKLDLVALPHYSDPEPADHWGLIIFK
jgi:aminopeptidase N